MSYELTGNRVSDTYIRLVQCVSGNYYDGAGNPLNITDASFRLDPSLDYATYEPMVSNVSFNYAGELITQIITTNILGTKTVDFIYDANDDISVININNYGKWLRTITFEKDVNENITAIHIA